MKIPFLKLTERQKLFLFSKANGADNRQDLLPNQGWTWPKKTWLERRLEQIRKEQSNEHQTAD